MLGALHTRARWLLLYDNAEQSGDLAQFLPGGSGHVVITSRHPGWQEMAALLPVDVFDPGESTGLLRGWLTEAQVQACIHSATRTGGGCG